MFGDLLLACNGGGFCFPEESELMLDQTINNPSPTNYDEFGSSVSLHGDTLVIGALYDDAGATNAGSAYVYTRSGTSWSLQQTINNPSPASGDLFGLSVSLYQDTLVISSAYDDTGASNAGSAYVYTRSGTTWSLQQTINNPTPASVDNFGSSVSLYGDTLVIGTPYDDTGASDAGTVYVYTRSGTTWTLQQTINNPSPGYGDNFGYSISLYQDTLVIGTPWDDHGVTDAGSVYVYTRSGTTWSLQQHINNPSPGDYDWFGYSVSSYGDTLVIGIPYNDVGATYKDGSVYVYTRSGTSWFLQQTIDNPSTEGYDYFGNSVSLYGDTLVIGTPRDETGASDAGSVYVYTRSGTTWSLQQTINNPTPAVSDRFGWSVSSYGDTLVIGTHWDDTGASDAGSVYVYKYKNSNTIVYPLRTLFYDNFATIDSNIWFKWGYPLPYIKSDSSASNGYALDINGDSNYHSGATSNGFSFNAKRDFTIRVRARCVLNGTNPWSYLYFGLATSRAVSGINSSVSYTCLFIDGGKANAINYPIQEIRYGVSLIGPAHPNDIIPINQPYSNDGLYHEYEIKFEITSCPTICTFTIKQDGVIKSRRTGNAPTNDLFYLACEGRSYGNGDALVDWIKVDQFQ